MYITAPTNTDVRVLSRSVSLTVLALVFQVTVAAAQGEVVAWGHNGYGQCTIPSPNVSFAMVAAGLDHSLGLKFDSSIVAWGSNEYGQCTVSLPNAGFIAMAAGGYHSLGLKADGSIAAWGWNAFGQCDVAWPNSDFVAVAGGMYHSLGLRADGSIEGWGYNGSGQLDVPPPNANFIAIAAGNYHSLGLKSDGTVVAWGLNTSGQCNVPPPNHHFVTVAARDRVSSGLRVDGTIIAWGDNSAGQCNVPLPNADFVAADVGAAHGLGLKSDGSIVAWGLNMFGQCTVPPPNAGFAAVAVGMLHSLGLKGAVPDPPIVTCRSLQIYDTGTGAPDTSLIDFSVTVEGVVYVPPGTYSDDSDGYLQDATGGIGFRHENMPSGVHTGDRIRITGSLRQSGGELHIAAYSCAKLDSGLTVTPTNYSVDAVLGDFGNTGTMACIRGTVADLSDDSFWLLDGAARIQVRRSSYAGVDFSSLSAGDHYSVIGPCLKQDNVLYLMPARQTDLVAKQHFVSNFGDDGNPGTRALPFRTIQHAVDSAVSGDVVSICDGSYSGAGNVNVCWANKNLTICADSGVRSRCVIVCDGQPGFVYSETIAADRDTIAFLGISILQASTAIGATGGHPRNGFYPIAVVVRDCGLMGGDYGLFIRDGQAIVERSTVSDQATAGVDVGGAYQCNVTIRNCAIRRNGTGVRQWSLQSSGYAVFDSTDVVANGIGVTLFNDSAQVTLSHCRMDSSTVGDGCNVRTYVGGPVLSDCKFDSNARSGFSFFADGGGYMSATNCQAVGNGLHGFELDTFNASDTLDHVLISHNGAWGIGEYTWTLRESALAGHPQDAEKKSACLRVSDSELRSNAAGGMDTGGSLDRAELTRVALLDNGGPGIRCEAAVSGFSLALAEITVAGNNGDGVRLARCSGTASRTVIVGNDSLAVSFGEESSLSLSCSDIFGNRDGDWIGVLAPQLGANGNLCVDPRFCDIGGGDYALQTSSPLTADNNPSCGTIGRYDAECPAQPWDPFEPRIRDVPADQGGYLCVAWRRHGADSQSATIPITQYEVQDGNGGWHSVATLVAASADSYAVIIATPNIQTVGQPFSYSRYRLVARTAMPSIFFESAVDSACSIDNLPPPKPAAMLVDAPDYRYVVWTSPDIPDFASACVFRGDQAGFTPGEPLTCPPGGFFAETHLAWYFYRVQFADIHGNLSEFSDELHGQFPTGVSETLPTVLRLYPCRPNPFNPRTTIKYDLPAAGVVRLAVFDLAGRLVRTLVNESKSRGSYDAVWDGRDSSGREVSSGAYLARLSFGGRVETVRMGLIR